MMFPSFDNYIKIHFNNFLSFCSIAPYPAIGGASYLLQSHTSNQNLKCFIFSNTVSTYVNIVRFSQGQRTTAT